MILAQYEHLPIYKAAFDLLVYFEQIVKNFSRYNKYTHGTALRELSREILMLIIRANNTYNKRPVLEQVRMKQVKFYHKRLPKRNALYVFQAAQKTFFQVHWKNTIN